MRSPFTLWFFVLYCMLKPESGNFSPTSQPNVTLTLDPWVSPGMLPDPSYCELLLQAPVPPPADQVPWFCMCSTCPNNIGEKGERGDRGLPGTHGTEQGFTTCCDSWLTQLIRKASVAIFSEWITMNCFFEASHSCTGVVRF